MGSLKSVKEELGLYWIRIYRIAEYYLHYFLRIRARLDIYKPSALGSEHTYRGTDNKLMHSLTVL